MPAASSPARASCGRASGSATPRGGPAAAKWRKEIGAAPDESDRAWLTELAAWAEEQRLSAPPEDLEVLVKAVERGLPPRTHLILAAEALRPHGKKLARDAELELKQRLGDDLRLIATELEKLALHAGERALISRADVEAMVAPVREEEFFALAEAVGEGDLGRALQLFHDELRRKANATAVALPFLGGVAGSVRRALADHARYSALPAARCARELRYDEFQRSVFPEVEAEL